MGIFEGFVIYIVLWWVIFFMTLPLRFESQSRPQKGHAESAPAHPRIAFKMALTSGIALIVWLIVYAVIEADVYSFYE